MYSYCVIPARGGSKRIPRKNIRSFCGRPMISWSIDAARRSGCFHSIIVSTDDQEIAALAQACGAEVPFLRPEQLADDFAPTSAVISHAIGWIKAQNKSLEAICCLYATAPFVRPSELRLGFEMLAQVEPDRFVFTATSFPSPIQRALRIDPETGRAAMFQPNLFSVRSQDLELAFHDAAQFYWGRAQAWLGSGSIFEGSKPLLLPRWRVQDIDTEDDWTRAELIHQVLFR